MTTEKFYCNVCGFEEEYEVDEETSQLECPFCQDGIMKLEL